MSTPAPVSGATNVRYYTFGSSYDFADRRGGEWLVTFMYGKGKPEKQTLKHLLCRYVLNNKRCITMEDWYSLDTDFSGRGLHQKTYSRYDRVSSHILLTEHSVPEMVNLINCAGTAPEMFEFLMSVLSSTSTSPEEQSHLSDLAGLVKFVNQIYAKKSEEIPECFQVIDPENFEKFENKFPPTFGWVRTFCECDRSFSQNFVCDDILETCLNNFAQYCRDEIKKKMDEPDTVKLIKEVWVHETEKFLANSEQVVKDWLATL
jgi:hypothetical protein